MELLENKIIREKLESLDKLPSNYEVDLASKFDLVMQANQPKKKNYLLWVAVPASIAASFVLFLMFGNSQFQSANTALKVQNHQSNNFEDLKTPKQMAIGYPVKVKGKKLATPSKKVDFKTSTIPQSIQQANQFTKVDSVFSEIQIVSNNSNLKQKKSRFREIDFNEQLIPVNLASESKKEQGFIRFKLPDGAAVTTIQPEKFLSYRQSF